MADHGLKLLDVLRDQRRYYERNADGERITTNPMMYKSCEDEALRLQYIISRQNKKTLSPKTLRKPEVK